MNRLDQLINEIQGYKGNVNQRTAIQIYNILENNKTLFLSKVEKENFTPVLKDFERLSNASYLQSTSAEYKREYQRAYDLLAFHLNRI